MQSYTYLRLNPEIFKPNLQNKIISRNSKKFITKNFPSPKINSTKNSLKKMYVHNF